MNPPNVRNGYLTSRCQNKDMEKEIQKPTPKEKKNSLAVNRLHVPSHDGCAFRLFFTKAAGDIILGGQILNFSLTPNSK